MRVALIDEMDCFAPIRQAVESIDISVLEPDYLVTPNPSFIQKMIEHATGSNIVVIHRAIWVDECQPKETCIRLKEF